MAKLTLEQLRKLREDNKKNVDKRDVNADVTILVGMGTCGIAAGARETMKSFVDNVDKMGLKNIVVKQTGCMGACYVEPTVEVHVKDMPETLYGKVDAEVAKQILEQHVVNKQLVNDHVYDKPAADIME